MSDRHVRHTKDDYAGAILDLFPSGPSWPRDEEANWVRLVDGLADVWGDPVDARAADLLEIETDPRATNEMLLDWERAFGLPDLCVTEPLTVEDRRRALINQMTTEGGQSRDFFVSISTRLGYNIEIIEYSPFIVGISNVGDTRPTGDSSEKFHWELGPPEMRFYWTVHVLGVRVSWFRVSSGQCGIDPLARISFASDLECLFRRWKPAHTKVIFDYSTAVPIYFDYIQFRVGIHQCGVDPLLRIISHGGPEDGLGPFSTDFSSDWI
jgi:uncharacterized protein YmfQ (DUF2313 family)